MKKVNIFGFDKKAEILCILGWDEQHKTIVILKGKTVGRNILRDRFFSSKTLKHISIEKSGQKKFFEQLPFCFENCSRMWAEIANFTP